MHRFWAMIRFEIRSVRWQLLGGLVAMSVVIFMMLKGGVKSSNLVPILPWLMTWVYAQRNKEKRERLWALMPVSRHQAALLRIVIVMLPYALFVGLTWMLERLAPASAQSIDWRFVGGFVLGLLMVFYIAFLIGDHMAGRPKWILKTTSWVAGLVIGSVVAVAFVIFAIYSRSGPLGRALDGVVTALVQSSFFHQPGVWLRLLSIVFLLAGATVFSFGQRRSYME